MKTKSVFQVIACTFVLISLLGSALTVPNQIVLAKSSAAIFTNCASQTQIPESECNALVALYDGTDGPNWYQSSGWLQTDTPCSWSGVTCANGTNVTTLSRFSADMSGPIPVELANLTQLQSLILGHNYLSGPIPIQLGSLTKLTNLELELNQLSGPIPAELGNLAQLEHLSLSGNHLTGPIPAQLGKLTNLANLVLSNNRLSGPIPAQLGNLIQLESLDLSENLLTGSIPTGLSSLVNLSWLDLSWNQLSGPIPVQLGSLTNLAGLLLNNNFLSGPMPAQLGNLTKLFRLYLHGNQLSGEIPVTITNLTSLTDLLLSCGLDSSNPVVISFVNKAWPDWQKFLCLPSVTLISVAEQDGWIIESSETSGVGGTQNSSAASIYLGDNQVRRQYRGILSFRSGAGLPDSAIITAVTLKVKQQGVTGGGNPLTIFQGLMIDVKNGFFGSTPALQIGDFQALASQTFGPFMPVPASNWYTLDLTSAKTSINKLTAGSGLTQIRLRFKLDDNNDALANYLSLFSGSAPSVSQPQLIVQYYVP
jgi:hypothetical protein